MTIETPSPSPAGFSPADREAFVEQGRKDMLRGLCQSDGDEVDDLDALLENRAHAMHLIDRKRDLPDWARVAYLDGLIQVLRSRREI